MQTPATNEEAALALGATKWEMIRTAVLPYGKPGVIAAVMLGLGRALGETIALALTLGIVFNISFNLIENGGNTHRRQHRQHLRRGQRHRPRRADRLRPGAVRHHAGGQHDRAGDHLPPPRVPGQCRMTATRRPQPPDVAMTPDNIRTQQAAVASPTSASRSPRSSLVRPRIVLGTGIGNWVLVVVVGAVLYLVGLFAAATPGRGPPRGPQPDLAAR